MPQHIFSIGLNDFNRRKLERIDGAGDYVFHGVLAPEEILEAKEFPIRDMLQRIEDEIERSPDPANAVLAYMDFPVSTIVPLLCRKFGLRGPTMESLLLCEHKYWSRVAQSRVVPDNIPSFRLIDPFSDTSPEELGLEYPFWLKPIKSAGSYLGFRIASADDLRRARGIIRQHIGRFAEPFNRILDQAAVPDGMTAADGYACMAESIIGGRQCTVEGSVHGGEVTVWGVIDSIRDTAGSSFGRYQYPSQLPGAVIDRMRAITERVLAHIGFDDSAFNVEFFYDEAKDHLWLLEINTRIAQHHSDLFEKVDGRSNHQFAVQVALGERPRFPHRQGEFACAAACFVRTYEDARVVKAPTRADLDAIAREIPAATVDVHVHEGQRLSELPDQDSYSFDLGIVYVGGADEREIVETYQRVLDRLPIELERP